MDPDRYARLKGIVLTAASLPEPERQGYLDRECGDDPELRHEAEALLSHAARGAPGLRTGALWTPLGRALDATLPQAAPLPGRIGPYRVLGLLGEGGMGVVYRAEQEEPVRREVALKVIRGGFDSGAVLARFEAERRTLASLDHPNIARFVDADSTEDGRPYFVMELVHGTPLTDFCRARRLEPAARLALFLDVCRAVRHAHRRGIIHRDLKPSNVLVTDDGERPAVKVIDFSIAKALAAPGLATEFRTRTGQIVGTLEYMSPEQARGEIDSLDTRSDVYALGVLLYELLADRLPYDIAGRPLHEAVRMVVEEAPRPLRGTTTRGSGRLDADVETIVRRCLEKQPDRRYGSAAELADDLERHLTSRPILARPPSALYQTRKFVARHRVGTAALALVILALAGGVVGTSVGLARARGALARAETEMRKAERINAFLDNMLAAAGPEERGRDVTVKAVLDAATAGLLAELADEPEVDAAVRTTIGTTYRTLEAYRQAEPLLKQALRERLQRLPPGDPEIGRSRLELANLYLQQERFHEAEGEARRALVVLRSAPAPDSRVVARALRVLAQALTNQDRWDEAERTFVEALALYDPGAGSREVELQRARAQLELAFLLFRTGRYEGSVALAREALATDERLLRRDHPAVAHALHALGLALGSLGRYPEAESCLRESLALKRRFYGDQAVTVARTLRVLGMLVADSSGPRLDEAEALVRESIAINRSSIGSKPLLAGDLNGLAVFVLAGMKGRRAEAEALARESIDILEHEPGRGGMMGAIAWNRLGAVLLSAGRAREAEETQRLAIDRMRAIVPAGHPWLGNFYWDLSYALESQGRLSEALAAIEITVPMACAAQGEQGPSCESARRRRQEMAARAGVAAGPAAAAEPAAIAGASRP